MKVSFLPSHTVPNKALNTTFNSWKILPRTPHIPKLLPLTNKLLYNIQQRLTLAGQPYQLYHQVQTHVTYYIATSTIPRTVHRQYPLTTTNSFARTSSVQRAPTAITLFPLSTTTPSLEHCTSSCHYFPLSRAVGFICVSTRNTIIC